jgi:hypothetical protein
MYDGIEEIAILLPTPLFSRILNYANLRGIEISRAALELISFGVEALDDKDYFDETWNDEEEL